MQWRIFCFNNRHVRLQYFHCIRHEQLVSFIQWVWRNPFLGCIVLPWSWADSDSWCCWYFRAIASVFFNCLCISYDIMNAYILPQMTVISKKDWNIFLCLLEHTPFPILTSVPFAWVVEVRHDKDGAASRCSSVFFFYFSKCIVLQVCAKMLKSFCLQS